MLDTPVEFKQPAAKPEEEVKVEDKIDEVAPEDEPQAPAVDDDEEEEEKPEVEEKPEWEVRAEAVTEAQVKRYWRRIEQAASAPRVHQEDLDVGEKVLRYFDVSSQYGVSLGSSHSHSIMPLFAPTVVSQPSGR